MTSELYCHLFFVDLYIVCVIKNTNNTIHQGLLLLFRRLRSNGLFVKKKKRQTTSEVTKLCRVGKIQPSPFAYILLVAVCPAKLSSYKKHQRTENTYYLSLYGKKTVGKLHLVMAWILCGLSLYHRNVLWFPTIII